MHACKSPQSDDGTSVKPHLCMAAGEFSTFATFCRAPVHPPILHSQWSRATAAGPCIWTLTPWLCASRIGATSRLSIWAVKYRSSQERTMQAACNVFLPGQCDAVSFVIDVSRQLSPRHFCRRALTESRAVGTLGVSAAVPLGAGGPSSS